MKHTKGPWRVCYSDIQAKDHDGDDFSLTVARVNAFSASKEETQEEVANAQLIAAAPDLLKALKEIRTLHTGRASKISKDTVCAAEKAIAEAEGKGE